MKKIHLQTVGVALGMVLQESTALYRAYKVGRQYNQNPTQYGLNEIREEHHGQRPVVLLHGAVGTWNYLGTLAIELKNKNIPVFVINLGGDSPTNAQREKLFNKIREIQLLYLDKFNACTKVDIVAHSMGGNIGLYSAFSMENSSIEEKDPATLGELKFKEGSTPTAQISIGKVITLALPSNAKEVEWVEQAEKASDLYNITAKYDALMGHKKCALPKDQVIELEAAHVGIVYHPHITETVLKFLRLSI